MSLMSMGQLNAQFSKEVHEIEQVKVVGNYRKTYTNNKSLPSLMGISEKDKNQKDSSFLITNIKKPHGRHHEVQ